LGLYRQCNNEAGPRRQPAKAFTPPNCGRGVVGGMSAAPPAISDIMRNCRWGCIGNVTMKRDHSANRRMRSPPKRGMMIPNLLRYYTVLRFRRMSALDRDRRPSSGPSGRALRRWRPN
jgi:hypothetical protein